MLTGLVALLLLSLCPLGSQPGPAAVELFGPGVLSAGEVFRGSFTPDGNTFYFFKKIGSGEDYRMYSSNRTAGGWRIPASGSSISEARSRTSILQFRATAGESSSVRTVRCLAAQGGKPNAHLWYTDRTEHRMEHACVHGPRDHVTALPLVGRGRLRRRDLFPADDARLEEHRDDADPVDRRRVLPCRSLTPTPNDGKAGGLVARPRRRWLARSWRQDGLPGCGDDEPSNRSGRIRHLGLDQARRRMDGTRSARCRHQHRWLRCISVRVPGWQQYLPNSSETSRHSIASRWL